MLQLTLGIVIGYLIAEAIAKRNAKAKTIKRRIYQ